MTSETCGFNITVVSRDTIRLELYGSWQVEREAPSVEDVFGSLTHFPDFRKVEFDTQNMGAWNSGLLTFLLGIHSFCAGNNIEMLRQGLPPSVDRILSLSLAVPERKGSGSDFEPTPLLQNVGRWTIDYVRSGAGMIAFIGEVFVSCVKIFKGSVRFRASDLMLFVQQCGVQALPIVTLISLLVGLILAFVGAVQLKMFGAQVYVANLVGLAMAREMGAMMAAIIMAGRTGAAFAAQIGTMQVNEEIDAFKTMGINPVEFLVLPRMLALVFMMPLLCLYADFLGILGGAAVGIGMLDISVAEYYNQTQAALTLTHFGVGVFKSVIFGVLVAIAGCLRGIQCGRSSSAVGDAATSAVVTGIVFIIVSDAVLTIIFTMIGI